MCRVDPAVRQEFGGKPLPLRRTVRIADGGQHVAGLRKFVAWRNFESKKHGCGDFFDIQAAPSNGDGAA